MLTVWTRLSLKLRIIIGFGSLLLLFATGMGVGQYGLSATAAMGAKDKLLGGLLDSILEANVQVRDYRLLGQDELAARFRQRAQAIRQGLEGFLAQDGQGLAQDRRADLAKALDQFEGQFGQLEANRQRQKQITVQAAAGAQAVKDNVEQGFRKEISAQQNMAAIQGEVVSNNVVEILALANKFLEDFLAAQESEARYLLYKDAQARKDLEARHQRAEGYLVDLRKIAGYAKTEAGGTDFTPAVDKLEKVRQAYLASSRSLLELRDKDEELTSGVAASGNQLIEILKGLASDLDGQSAALRRRSVTLGLIILAAGLAVGLGVAVGMTQGISRPLNLAIGGLDAGASEVAGASNEISRSSQDMAAGASQQASSLEETSAALEELAAMTRQNAEHAGQADSLSRQAGTVIDDANQSMDQLTDHMHQIHGASEEISKIIKTIDEIAFQTNLLALNAAVEAARAGEAGAGFAVVAEEVRNLALRASEAAKNTAELIEGTVGKIREGNRLVDVANQAFHEIARSSSQVASLVSEIAAASSEQSQGIDQVNRAVAEMDRVVQKNAANAEQSASASMELLSQADSLRQMVVSLVVLVRGRGADQTGGQAAQGQPALLPEPAEAEL